MADSRPLAPNDPCGLSPCVCASAPPPRLPRPVLGPFGCPSGCSFVGPTGLLRTHVANAHSNAVFIQAQLAPLGLASCPFCNVVFLRSTGLAVHIRSCSRSAGLDLGHVLQDGWPRTCWLYRSNALMRVPATAQLPPGDADRQLRLLPWSRSTAGRPRSPSPSSASWTLRPSCRSAPLRSPLNPSLSPDPLLPATEP